MFNFEANSTESEVDDNGLMSEDLLQEGDNEKEEQVDSSADELKESTEYADEKENEEDDGNVDHDNFNDVDET